MPKKIQQNLGENYCLSGKIQAEASSHLLSLTQSSCPNFSPQTAVDLGCGPGTFTVQLASLFPNCRFLGVDRDVDLISYAKALESGANCEFVLDDFTAYRPSFPVDWVMASSSLHWVPSPQDFLNSFSSVFSSSTVMSAALFGPETYHELAIVLSDVLGFSVSLQAQDFLSLDQWPKLVSPYFSSLASQRMVYREKFTSIISLLRSIHDTRVKGRGLPDLVWTKGFLAELELAYLKRFGSIWTTYELLFLCAKGNKCL